MGTANYRSDRILSDIWTNTSTTVLSTNNTLDIKTNNTPSVSPADQGSTLAPTLAPIAVDYETSLPPGDGVPATTASEVSQENSSNLDLSWIAYLLVVIVFLFVAWRCYKCVSRRRVASTLSAQADDVLGDMQMVPSDDFEVNVNELL